MRPAPFLGWTLLGTAIFTFALTAAGYALESQYERVASWLDPITTFLLVAGVVTWIWRVIVFPRQQANRND